jgi:hypothetical protein
VKIFSNDTLSSAWLWCQAKKSSKYSPLIRILIIFKALGFVKAL